MRTELQQYCIIYIIIPSLAGVQNVPLTAGDTPTALLALTDMLYSCPDCSGISVDVNGELTVTLPLSVKCCSDGQVMLKQVMMQCDTSVITPLAYGGVHERENFDVKMAVIPLTLETGLGACR